MAGENGGPDRLTCKENPLNTFAPDASQLATKVPFRTATASTWNGNCVTVAELVDGRVAVGHSAAPKGTAILYTPAEWDAFLDGAKAGEFDRQG